MRLQALCYYNLIKDLAQIQGFFSLWRWHRIALWCFYDTPWPVQGTCTTLSVCQDCALNSFVLCQHLPWNTHRVLYLEWCLEKGITRILLCRWEPFSGGCHRQWSRTKCGVKLCLLGKHISWQETFIALSFLLFLWSRATLCCTLNE